MISVTISAETPARLKAEIAKLLSSFPSNDNDAFVHFMDVDDFAFDIDTRARNCLLAEKIQTLGCLMKYSKRDLLRIPNLGRKSANQIESALNKLGVALCA